MGSEKTSIEVFQELTLRDSPRELIRASLVNFARAPWQHTSARERQIDLPYDMMVFERNESDGLTSCELVLMEERNGYKVVNVVPSEVGQLTISEYNDALNDFLSRVAEPASMEAGFYVGVSKRKQRITDWTSKEAARALRTFSLIANMSTGSSHPSDQKRWFAFIIAAYKAEGSLDGYLLGRWLEEVENWPASSARELVIEYEFAIDLLREYDSNVL